MPKLKTRKSAAKRVKKVTDAGKVIARERSNQHLSARKSKRQLAGSGRSKTLPKTQGENMRSLLPYGK